MIAALAITSCILALVPAVLFLRNLALYRPLPPAGDTRRACSVLIPARNEEANIEAAVRSALASEGVVLEVVVLDDGSTDNTAKLVRQMARQDSRVRLEFADPLPSGWAGKNHACHQLSSLARHPLLVFLDADVRVSRPDSLAQLAHFVETGDAALVSGVPRQETGSLLEKLVVPLIHFVLLGFLPLGRMRASTDPRFAAACGQIMVVRRDAYILSGGHSAIPNRLHDALALARSFRGQGYRTDLFDATDTFHCRMYRTAREVWDGFAKNAHEALAAPQLIGPATVMLAGGQILPLLLVVLFPSPITVIATVAAFLPRILGAFRLRQSPLGAALHPFGIAVLLAIQWSAFIRSRRRLPAVWKGREYQPAPAP